MNKNTIWIVEGVTCAGKTKMVSEICSIMHKDCIMEEPIKPPANYNRVNVVGHQRLVFESYMASFVKNKLDAFADFSPFGCIPFEIALVKAGVIKAHEAEKELAYMIPLCNGICKKNRLLLHRFLDSNPEIIMNRLKKRDRDGDATWTRDFIEILLKSYRDFFTDGNAMKIKNDRIVSLDLEQTLQLLY